MAGAGDEVHGNLVLALQAQAVDGDVRLFCLRVRGIAQAHGDVGAGVLLGVGGGGDELPDIKALLGGVVHHLLALGLGGIHHHRGDGVGHSPVEQLAQVFWLFTQQIAHPLAAGQHADGHSGVGVTFHVVKDHGGAFPGGAGDGAAGTHIAIHAGELGVGVHFHVGLHILPVYGLEQLQRRTQIVDVCHVNHTLF